MALDESQVGSLIAAGSIRIPPDCDFGLLNVDTAGIAGMAGVAADATIEIGRYSSPTQKTTYIVPAKNVTAIFLPEGVPGAPGPRWLMGGALDFAAVAATGQAPAVPLVGAAPLKGTVFMKEDAGVLMRTEVALTAGDIADIPASCTDQRLKC